MVRNVPFTGDEKDMLLVAIERHRDAALWKIDGLDDEQLRRRLTPSGTSLLGLVKHLAWVDYGWFCETFAQPFDDLGLDGEDGDADLRIEPDETTAEIIAYFGRSREACNAVVAAFEMDSLGTAWFGEQVTLRWVMVHMLEEWARHVGQMDILRELVDGATGDHDRTD